MKIIYADNNATTMPAPEVVDAMLPFFTEMWANPSSMHTFGGQVSKYIEKARASVATLVGASSAEIVFTSCGTESDNTAIRSALATSGGKRHLVTSSVEHPAVLNLAKHLEKEGVEVTSLGVDSEGRLDLASLENSLRPDTFLVSIMWANNETGVVFPIDQIAEICAQRKISLHVDAVQAAGKLSLDMRKTPITYLSISGHKLHSSKGAGALYVRKGTPFSPWLLGGHQERGRRGGTENVASLVGFGTASELALLNMQENAARIASLRDRLERKILDSIPYSFVHGGKTVRLPNTSNIGFEGVEGEAILLMLNECGICASSGSACASGSLDPSHVMMAMGIPFTRAHGSIRFSLSRYNTEDEIDFIAEKLPAVIRTLRELSPIKAGAAY